MQGKVHNLKQESIESFFTMHLAKKLPDCKGSCGPTTSDDYLRSFMKENQLFIKKTCPINNGDHLKITYRSTEYIANLPIEVTVMYYCEDYDDHSRVLNRLPSMNTKVSVVG